MTKLLVVDDEAAIRRFLKISLSAESYEVIEAVSGHQAVEMVNTRQPDVVLLDLGLPDMDGTDVTRMVREWSKVPIIVISARGQEHDKVTALDAGADDYLTKPFSLGELEARIRVALRHKNKEGSTELSTYRSGRLFVDLTTRTVTVDEKPVHLTKLEFNLLAVMVRNAGKVVTHRQLLGEVWGPADVEQTQYLRVYMGQLRHKIEVNPANPVHITTESGVGYRLAPPSE